MSSLNNLSKVLAAATQEVVFVPTADMRRAKAAFWTSLSDHPLGIGDADTLTLAASKQLGADSRLSRWWAVPGFVDWWQNKQEFKQRLEYMAQLALDSLEEILTDPGANPTAKVNSAKLVLDAANKMPKKVPEENLDTKLSSMSRAELEEYVRSKVKYLTPAVETVSIDTVLGVDSDTETRTTGSTKEGVSD
jgi:hypothetical protein